MYMNILLVSLLGSLTLIPALAIPIPEVTARAFPTECTNYVGYTAGSYIENLRSPMPATFPLNSNVQWCHEGSTTHIEFVSPAHVNTISSSLPFTKSSFAKLFDDATAALKKENQNAVVPNNAKLYDATGFSLYAEAAPGGGKFTYAQALLGAEILQNYLYISKNYASYYVEVFEGRDAVGFLKLSAEEITRNN